VIMTLIHAYRQSLIIQSHLPRLLFWGPIFQHMNFGETFKPWHHPCYLIWPPVSLCTWLSCPLKEGAREKTNAYGERPRGRCLGHPEVEIFVYPQGNPGFQMFSTCSHHTGLWPPKVPVSRSHALSPFSDVSHLELCVCVCVLVEFELRASCSVT
jgi:hypothetical protein